MKSVFSRVLLFASFCLIATAQANEPAPFTDKQATADAALLSPLQQKFYQRALYFHYLDQPVAALNTLVRAEHDLTTLSPESSLFYAGLSMQFGLNQQSIARLTRLVAEQKNIPQNLLGLTLLQLAQNQLHLEQQLSAQAWLEKITQLPIAFKNQFLLAQQLAYWPAQPESRSIDYFIPENYQPKHEASEPFLKLNSALFYAEKGDFKQAKSLLLEATQGQFYQPLMAENNFWFTVFNEQESLTQVELMAVNSKEEREALIDYSHLLIAQLAAEQEDWQSAYNELIAFPFDSAFSEQALFLLGVSAEKLNNNSLAKTVWLSLGKRYPYGQLGWQAPLFYAQLLQTEDGDLSLVAYQDAEQLYQEKSAALAEFQKNLRQYDFVEFVNQQSEATVLSPQVEKAPEWLNDTQSCCFVSENAWLKQLISDDGKVHGQLLQLKEIVVLQNALMNKKGHLIDLEDALTLQFDQHKRIAKQAKESHYSEQVANVSQRFQGLTAQVEAAKNGNDVQLLLDAQQQAWGQQIQSAAAHIKHIKVLQPEKDLSLYQARLDRIRGLFHWQLADNFTGRLWQHEKLAKQINKVLAETTNRLATVHNIQQKPAPLEQLAMRLKKQQMRVNNALIKSEDLLVQSQAALKEYLGNKINQKQHALNTFTLTTRRAMAELIEQALAEQEKLKQAKLKHRKVVMQANQSVVDSVANRPTAGSHYVE